MAISRRRRQLLRITLEPHRGRRYVGHNLRHPQASVGSLREWLCVLRDKLHTTGRGPGSRPTVWVVRRRQGCGYPGLGEWLRRSMPARRLASDLVYLHAAVLTLRADSLAPRGSALLPICESCYRCPRSCPTTGSRIPRPTTPSRAPGYVRPLAASVAPGRAT